MSQALETAEAQSNSKPVLGFWVYIMTDCLLFASLFAAYAVLSGNTAGGPDAKELFHLPFVLIETMLLLTSSFTCGLALLSARAGNRKGVLMWFGITFALGIAFLGMELYEFNVLVQEGASWRRSGFLSAYFTLVGTHGAHITVGLLWIAVMLQRVWQHGLGGNVLKRLTMLSLFWHFLDVIWIFIFTVVYLLGVGA